MVASEIRKLNPGVIVEVSMMSTVTTLLQMDGEVYSVDTNRSVR